MRILDRYLIRRFCFSLIFSLIAFWVIFLVVDLVEHVDKYIDKQASVFLVIKYYLYQRLKHPSSFNKRLFELSEPNITYGLGHEALAAALNT